MQVLNLTDKNSQFYFDSIKVRVEKLWIFVRIGLVGKNENFICKCVLVCASDDIGLYGFASAIFILNIKLAPI